MPLPYYTRAEIDLMLSGSTGIYFYNNENPRPVEGTENILYVDKSNKRAYLWNTVAGDYELIGTELTYQAIVDALGYVPVDQGGNTTDTGQTLRNDIDLSVVRLGKIEGMTLVADMPNQKILLNNADGVLITELNVGWLNNEGTVFSYNTTTENLELKNDQDELLASIPVSSFVSNLASTINFNGTAPSTLELKDNTGTVISSVNITIANVDGLQAALDEIAILEQVEITGLDIQTHKFTLSDSTVIETTYAPKFEVVEHPDGHHNYRLRGYGVTFGADTSLQGNNIGFGYSHNVTKGYGNFMVGSWHDVIDGGAALISGYYNQVDKGAYGTIVTGAYNLIRTNYSAIFGYNNKDIHTVNGTSLNYPDGGNVVGGFNNTIAEGWGIGMFGAGHIQKGNNVVVVGQASANLNGTDKSVNVGTDARFIVGNGNIAAGSYTRQTGSNAFVVYHSGLVVAPTLTSALIDTQARALVTREYLEAAITAGGSGSVAWADITGTPTTLAGYGITDGVRSVTGNIVNNTDPDNPQVQLNIGNGLAFWDDIIQIGNLTEDTSVNGQHNSMSYLQLSSFSAQTYQEDWGDPYGMASGGIWVNPGGYNISSHLNHTPTDKGISVNESVQIDDTDSARWRVAIAKGTTSSKTWISELQMGSDYFDIRVNGLSAEFPTTYSGGNIPRTIPFSVNGIFADTSGNITLPMDGGGGGVQSVTGTGVDNTDPLNPIINVKDGSFTKVSTPDGNSYVLDYYDATSNTIGGEANVILGSGNDTGNTYEGFIMGNGNTLADYSWYSFIIGGYNNFLGGVRTFVLGESNNIDYPETAAVIGANNELGLTHSLIVGKSNIGTYHPDFWGENVFISGFDNEVRGSFATTAIGMHHIIDNIDGLTVLGNASDQSQFGLDSVLVVGNGTLTNKFGLVSRSNAFQIRNNGTVTANSLTTALIDAEPTGKVLITKEWFNANASSGSGGGGDVSWADITDKPTTLAGYGITDAYQSWNLKTNGVQRTTVQSGGTLDIVATGASTVSYSAGGVVTIDTPVVTPTDISKTVQVDSAQTFTAAEQKQGRDNIVAEKRAEVRIPTVDPTNQNFIDWESDILLVKTARTFTLPASGVLANGSRFLVKTTSTGTVQFAAADGTVTIEYNDVNATGYMAQRSEAWVLFQDDVYYVSGEVA